jgi:hypothetical protein
MRRRRKPPSASLSADLGHRGVACCAKIADMNVVRACRGIKAGLIAQGDVGRARGIRIEGIATQARVVVASCVGIDRLVPTGGIAIARGVCEKRFCPSAVLLLPLVISAKLALLLFCHHLLPKVPRVPSREACRVM